VRAYFSSSSLEALDQLVDEAQTRLLFGSSSARNLNGLG
jgi:hypothetical protein